MVVWVRRQGEKWGVYACVGLGVRWCWGVLVTVVGQPLEEQAQGYVAAYGVHVYVGVCSHIQCECG
jgi:hypothetical protein